MKVAPGTTFTSWSQHHFVAIRMPESQVRKASQWQQATIKITYRAHSINVACSRHIYMGVVPCAHFFCGEPHIQRNASGEVATEATDMQELVRYIA